MAKEREEAAVRHSSRGKRLSTMMTLFSLSHEMSTEQQMRRSSGMRESLRHYNNERQLKMNCHTWYDQSFSLLSLLSLNFLGVIKLSISFYHIICSCSVGGRIKAPNQIGLLSFDIPTLSSAFRKWKFISFYFTSQRRIPLSLVVVFALIKLCFDCHVAWEYVIKADLRGAGAEENKKRRDFG